MERVANFKGETFECVYGVNVASVAGVTGASTRAVLIETTPS